MVRQIILPNSAVPTDISDFTLRHILQEDTLSSANHVSAIDISSTTPPKSLKSHQELPVNDKAIWYMDYEEECCGLHNKKKTWTYISEEQYKHLKPAVGNALQKISIATIITDANSKPQRAKYRVCVIGNIDPTNWSLNKVFAPVLFQLKLRILTTIAVQKRSKFNTGDFKQAFCQEYLPDGETYVLRPPKYCPITTTPNMYLHIIQTLYGLKRSPRHWYEKARATFL